MFTSTKPLESAPTFSIGSWAREEKALIDSFSAAYASGRMTHEAFLVSQEVVWSVFNHHQDHRMAMVNPAGYAAELLLKRGVTPDAFRSQQESSPERSWPLKVMVSRMSAYEVAKTLIKPGISDYHLCLLCGFYRAKGVPVIDSVSYAHLYERQKAAEQKDSSSA